MQYVYGRIYTESIPDDPNNIRIETLNRESKLIMSDHKKWNLVADIGGTNARFAVHDIDSDELSKVIVYSVANHPTFVGALQHLLIQLKQEKHWEPYPQKTCLAVASPVEQDRISFTNSGWTFTRSELAQTMKNSPVLVINDFSAVAWAIPHLRPFEWHQIGGSTSKTDKPIAILGPGTGLGMCNLVPAGDGYTVLAGEGGHIDFAPVTARQVAILQQLQTRFQRVSVERLLSGSGIVNIYQSLCALENVPRVHTSAQQITDTAMNKTDPLSVETLSIFCEVLGATASNQALIMNARGGVYVAGGIVPRILDFIKKSDFRSRFDDKGRFRGYVEQIPVRIILKEHLGLFGALQKIKHDNTVTELA